MNRAGLIAHVTRRDAFFARAEPKETKMIATYRYDDEAVSMRADYLNPNTQYAPMLQIRTDGGTVSVGMPYAVAQAVAAAFNAAMTPNPTAASLATMAPLMAETEGMGK